MNDQTFILADAFRTKLQDVISGTKTQKGTDVQVELFLNERLPEIIALVQTVMADGRLNISELVTVVTFTVRAVKDGLDIYSEANQEEKTVIVREILQFVIGKLWAGDSALEKFLLGDALLDSVIKLVYHLAVKR